MPLPSSPSTSFRARVLAVVRSIPRGQTLSYSAVASHAGSPRAARAVGTIMRDNHNPLIPCHRVVRSDGTIGAYNGGVQKKRALLLSEGVRIDGDRILEYDREFHGMPHDVAQPPFINR